MEQIQQHEWVKRYKWFYKCPHCDCTKMITDTGGITYYPDSLIPAAMGLTEEPECITRYPEQYTENEWSKYIESEWCSCDHKHVLDANPCPVCAGCGKLVSL